MLEVWPAILVAGICFAIPQFIVSNFHGPWLVDVVASLVSIAGLALFLKVWKPAKIWRQESGDRSQGDSEREVVGPPVGRQSAIGNRKSAMLRPWLPWIILSLVVFVWGLPQTKSFLDGLAAPKIPVYGLDKLVSRVPPVVAQPTAESAVFNLNFLSAAGTGIFLASIIAGLVMGFSPLGLLRIYWKTLKLVSSSLLTIAVMMAIGFSTRYSGMDATLGLAFAKTGLLYPFFGTMLGWLGVALTGSDTSSNVLFGSLQKITATQLGLSPVLMGAANSSGGVMGKMIDAQSIVVASTATRWHGHEGDILRYVFFHSLVLAALVGILVMLQAYVFPIFIVH